MKRISYIFLVMAVLTGAACTEIDPGSDRPDTRFPYIFFDAEVISSTRANLVEETSLPSDEGTSFGVFGYRNVPSENEGDDPVKDPVFEGVEEMFRPSDDGAFIYRNLTTWTEDQHDFYAYYPYDDNDSFVIAFGLNTESGDPYIHYLQPDSRDAMVDLMTAKAEKQTSNSAPVALQFQHRLFALDFELVDATTSDTPLEVNSVSVMISGIIEKADLLYDGSIIYTDRTLIIEEDLYNATDPVPFTDKRYNLNDGFSYLFLPCDDLSVYFELSGSDEWGSYNQITGSGKIKPVGGFKPGKKYTVTITKTDADGFVTSLSGWEGEEITHTFN